MFCGIGTGLSNLLVSSFRFMDGHGELLVMRSCARISLRFRLARTTNVPSNGLRCDKLAASATPQVAELDACGSVLDHGRVALRRVRIPTPRDRISPSAERLHAETLIWSTEP
jgi:hypothetical protein